MSPNIHKVLFVCLGNICRSPSAEAIFRKHCALNNIEIEFDSAGTISSHSGERSDPRSIRHAELRGYAMEHLARQVQVQDFTDFDLILAMDKKNVEDLKRIAPVSQRIKIKLVTDFCRKENPGYVPDPYYGQDEDFEMVLNIIEDACEGFIASLIGKNA